ncbi:MAG: hypothetical protein KGY99_09310 [Phycisphaerae bacterium]|nr:hypothetical protein [Phycisphaerae bacterium]
MWKRNALLLCVACLLVVVPADAKRQRVTLRDGGEIVGEVVKSGDTYTITTPGGVTMRVAADNVESIEDIVTPQDEYDDQAAGEDLSDPLVRYRLGRWASDKGYLQIAERELTKAIELRDGEFEMAQLLLKQVRQRIAATEDTGADDGGDAADDGVAAKHLMTMEDVNRIRRHELREDEEVAVSFKNNVRRRFVRANHGKGDFKEPGFERTFWRMSPLEQARYILKHTDETERAMRDDILLRRDPQFMVTYQRDIWPLIRNSCATAGCHGEKAAEGTFRLFPIAGNLTRAHYTNFYILSTHAVDGWKLIDRDHPDLSLLVQYGLPARYAERRHPSAIEPIFRDRDDPKYRRLVDWIESLDGPPFRGYDVAYEPPAPGSGEPTTRSTTRPADDEE